jgi:serine/threonine protein kinase
MIPEELRQISSQLALASQAEDVFGLPETSAAKEVLVASVKRTYLRLSHIVDPDFYPSDAEARAVASQSFARLKMFYEQAMQKVDAGTYGAAASPNAERAESGATITTSSHTYRIERALAQGDLSSVYAGTMDGTQDRIVVKVAEDPADNDLMMNELKTLRYLATEPGPYGKHLPQVIEDIRTQDQRAGIIMRFIDGVDLNQIREKYPKGIPDRHIIWIFRRTLSVLGYAHSKGVVHGNIEPSHIVVSPPDHNIFLIDWAYSVYKPAATGQGFRAVNEKFSAPEVREKKPPLPQSDLYSAGKCMIYLLGGRLETNELPPEVDERISKFIQFFVRESAQQRPSDAWAMYHELDDLREKVFGPHQFIEFKM